MDLSVLFLGTAGSMPTVQRAPASLLIRRGGDRILIDCGEGSQRQLLRSVGLPDIEHVFLTHYHADHFLGLPGMLKTFALRGRDVPLTVYGPRGLSGLMADLRRIYGKLSYEVQDGRARAERVGRASTASGSAPIPSSTGSRRSATRWSRTTRPGRFDTDRAHDARGAAGPLFGAPPARGGRRGCRQAGGRPRR